MITAQKVFDLSMKLINCTNQDGTINTQRSTQYAGKAIDYLTIIINDDSLKKITNTEIISTELTVLTDDLEYSDSICLTVLPYKLAYMFSADDKDYDRYNYLKAQYEANLGNSIPEVDEIDGDIYGLSRGMSVFI